MCCIIIFCAYGVLYAASTSLPGLLQTLLGYDAYSSGLVMSPSGIGSVCVMVVVGFLLGRGVDARWLIGSGLVIVGISNLWMANMTLQVSPFLVIWPRVVLAAGLGLLFAPLNVAAYLYIPKEYRGAAVGLLSLLRNEGGSVGTSMAQTLHERRDQFHTLRLNEYLDPLNPTLNAYTEQATATFYRETGDMNSAREMALQALAVVREQQSSSLAYFDIFWVAAVLSFGLVVLVFFMKRSVAEKGAHVGGE
jgi:DHA2 family multidrug resistance protein